MRRVATVGAVLGGLVLVALAARSYRPFGGEAGSERAPSTTFIDSFFTIALVLVAVGVVVAIAARLWTIRAAHGRREDHGLRELIMFLAMFLVVVAIAQFQINRWKRPADGASGESGVPGLVRPIARPAPTPATERTPRIVWPLVGGIGGLVVLALAAAIVIARRRPRGEGPSDEALAELRQALDEAIDDLRRDPDPRRAVVAAYARMEQALTVYGLPRRQAETPHEYLGRVGIELEAQPSVAALTELFEQAKFSEHVMDELMRDRAIGALSAVRDEVRATA